MTNGFTAGDDVEGAMSSAAHERGLPSRNLEQLRKEAHDLLRAIASGESNARERVLRSHPKYVGRPAERLETRSITLRDAQETVARERGAAGWQDLVEQLNVRGEAPRRWNPQTQLWAEFRTVAFARRSGAALATVDHILGALAAPAEPTLAARVLADLGYVSPMAEAGEEATAGGTASTPAQQAVVAAAAGLAIGLGAAAVTDEHVLLALAFTPTGVGLLVQHNLDPGEVVAGLAAGGVAVPGFAPPVPALPPGPFGPRVYFRGKGEGLAPELRRRYPPGTVWIGFNTSAWKPGWGWVDAEDEAPLEEIVRSVISEPGDIEVVPWWEAVLAESRARDAE